MRDFKYQNLAIVPIFGNYTENHENMNRNKSISLGYYFDNFIQSKISAGRYKNASEVVQAGLRLLEKEENRFMALSRAIQEGIESGASLNFNPELHLE
jgi:antitoxin ParD1/3/4